MQIAILLATSCSCTELRKCMTDLSTPTWKQKGQNAAHKENTTDGQLPLSPAKPWPSRITGAWLRLVERGFPFKHPHVLPNGRIRLSIFF